MDGSSYAGPSNPGEGYECSCGTLTLSSMGFWGFGWRSVGYAVLTSPERVKYYGPKGTGSSVLQGDTAWETVQDISDRVRVRAVIES